jgi:hypothetical protein
MVRAVSSGFNAVGGKPLTAWTLSACRNMQPYCNKRLGELQRYASTSEEKGVLGQLLQFGRMEAACAEDPC